LSLLKAVPRRWLEDGRRIELHDVATYFGRVNFIAKSRLADGVIEATAECARVRKPGEVRIRLPHPEGLKPRAVEGGKYDSASETVTVKPFNGHAKVVLHFS